MSEKGHSPGWRGLMADADRPTRAAALSMLAVACVAMVATQLSYLVVGDAHMVCVLAPVTAAALLFGPRAGAVVGGVAGLAEMVHATLLPLDAYERYFQAPWNSIALFALVGLVMGMLYAHVDRWRGTGGWRRPAGLALCCAVGSLLFTTIFNASGYLISSLVSFEVPAEILSQITGSKEALSQILANFGLMAMLALGADAVNARREATGHERSLRETFQGWLFVVVAVAYMVVAALSYTFVSMASRGSAELQMQGEIDYLEGQLTERDRLVEAVSRRTAATAAVLEEVQEASIGGVATGLDLGDGSVSAVAEDGTIVSSNVASYVGRGFEDVVGEGMTGGFDASVFDATRSVDWYMGAGEMGYLRAAEMGYVRVAREGSYQMMVAMPASAVFAYRGPVMAIVSGAFLLVFATVYLQASILLREVVVKGFDRTNEALERITGGDLDEVVDVHSSAEFTHLSGGINATVGSLKESMAEIEARSARDLATAKAIQESALPRTFPPFPEVEAFDIFASMDAAKEVGGDFYDFFLVDDHTLAFLIADVSGKGIPASLFMMAAKTEIANCLGAGMAVDEAIATANAHLCAGNDAGMFVTVWAATLDWDTGLVTYVNAGHNFPLLRHGKGGEWEWLKEKCGLFLGTFETAKYRQKNFTLEPGDELVLYTDGVNEAFSVSEEEFGNDRLEAYLAANADLGPEDLVHGLRAAVSNWAEGAEQSDDVTILALEYGAAPDATGAITVPATLDQLGEAMGLVSGELERRLCPVGVQRKVEVALEELFVNVCRYAYAGQEEPGQVSVSYEYRPSPRSITVTLQDWGLPFDPVGRKDPTKPSSVLDAQIGGLGILMVRRSMDDFSYRRDDDANVVSITKVW